MKDIMLQYDKEWLVQVPYDIKKWDVQQQEEVITVQ